MNEREYGNNIFNSYLQVNLWMLIEFSCETKAVQNKEGSRQFENGLFHPACTHFECVFFSV